MFLLCSANQSSQIRKKEFYRHFSQIELIQVCLKGIDVTLIQLVLLCNETL